MIGKLNHVAMAVPDLGAAIAQYRDILGGQVSEPVDEPDHGVTVAFVNLSNTKIELLYPLGEESPILGFLEKRVPGSSAAVSRKSVRTENQSCSYIQKIFPVA